MLHRTLLAVFIISAVGEELNKLKPPKEEVISNLQLLLPIKYLKPEQKAASVYSAAAPGRLTGLHDGPFSHIPAQEFTLDNTRLPSDNSPKKSVKKDLSSTYYFPLTPVDHLVDSDENLSTDTFESCLSYLFQGDLDELSRARISDLYGKLEHKKEHELLGHLCKVYVAKFFVDPGHTKEHSVHHHSLVKVIGDNLGHGGQAQNTGNPLNAVLQLILSDLGLVAQETNVGNAGLSGLDVNNGFATGVIDTILKGLTVGNLGVNKQHSDAGYSNLEEFGNVVANALSGIGGTGKFQQPLGGNGEQVNTVGVSGKDVLFGNLGGLGGLSANIDIGSGGLLNLLLGQPVSQKESHVHQPPQRLVAFGQVSKPKSELLEAKLGENPLANVKLDQVSPAPLAPANLLQALGASVVAETQNKLLEQVNTSNVADNNNVADLLEVAALGNAQTSAAASEAQGLNKNNVKESQTKEANGTVAQSSNDASKQVARVYRKEPEQHYVVGWLGVGEHDGQVGKLVSSDNYRGMRCSSCVRIFLRGGGAGAGTEALGSGQPLISATPPPLLQQARPLEQAPPQTKFRPLGGRRWIVFDNGLVGKLRQYIHTKKPWIVL